MKLPLANTEDRYGLVSILLHWAVAVMVVGLFGLGLYMTGLDYMHPWNRLAPLLHKGFGMILFMLVAARTLWRLGNTRPALASMPAWEKAAALLVHRLFYLLLFCVPLSGYLISTADGRGVEFFDWFEVPAVFAGIDRQEDVAGALHFYLAVFTIGLTGLHTLAALKHHFIDGDATLLKILGIEPKRDNHT